MGGDFMGGGDQVVVELLYVELFVELLGCFGVV